MAARDKEVAELLLERQASGLRVPAVARMVFATFGLATALTGDVPRDIVWLVIGLVIFSLAVNGYFVHLLNRRRHVELVGWLGVLFDVIIVATYPLILRAILASHGLHWIYGLKAVYGLVCICFVVINAMALRPVYPSVIGAAALAMHVVMVFAALDDPAVTWTSDVRQQLAGSAMGMNTIASQVTFLGLITIAVFLLTRSARKTVLEAVERQAERARLAREHAASVGEGRLDALRNLVASLSHEMNTPVGAIKSSTATIGSAVHRLADQIKVLDEKMERLIKLIGDTAPIPAEACTRLEDLLQRLTAFAHLDAGEVDSVDVNEALDRTLTLIPAEVIGGSEVEREYAARSRVRVAPARLNLALMTVVTNAFEANHGKGRVRLSTTEDESSVLVEITDEGPGIPADRRDRVFEFRIDDAETRIKAGLGLPAAYSLIKRHGGAIDVRPGESGGACFVITLPRADLSPSPRSENNAGSWRGTHEGA
jgi:signal transduction histidine kinase